MTWKVLIRNRINWSFTKDSLKFWIFIENEIVCSVVVLVFLMDKIKVANADHSFCYLLLHEKFSFGEKDDCFDFQ